MSLSLHRMACMRLAAGWSVYRNSYTGSLGRNAADTDSRPLLGDATEQHGQG